jgi:hypothetical protein
MRLRSSANVAALPRTGAIVFTICVYPTPIRDLGSGEAGWLDAAKRGIKEEELVYRCGVSFGSFLVWCWVGCMLMCFLCTDGIDDAIRASGASGPSCRFDGKLGAGLVVLLRDERNERAGLSQGPLNGIRWLKAHRERDRGNRMID